MIHRALALALVAVLALAACATPSRRAAAPSTGPVASAAPLKAGTGSPERKLVCRTERPTGSNIPERVCRWQDEIDAERARTQQLLMNQGTLTAPWRP